MQTAFAAKEQHEQKPGRRPAEPAVHQDAGHALDHHARRRAGQDRAEAASRMEKALQDRNPNPRKNLPDEAPLQHCRPRATGPAGAVIILSVAEHLQEAGQPRPARVVCGLLHHPHIKATMHERLENVWPAVAATSRAARRPLCSACTGLTPDAQAYGAETTAPVNWQHAMLVNKASARRKSTEGRYSGTTCPWQAGPRWRASWGRRCRLADPVRRRTI